MMIGAWQVDLIVPSYQGVGSKTPLYERVLFLELGPDLIGSPAGGALTSFGTSEKRRKDQLHD